MIEFDFGEGPVSAHKHPNGGGWVADTATVDETAICLPAEIDGAMDALRQALETEQEPVAWISEGGDVSRSKRYMDEMGFKCNPLYTSPPKRMNVYLKLNSARSAFHKLALKKSGQNKFAGYQYFELGDFIIPALNIFSEVGLCPLISFGAEEARMEIVNADNPEEKIVITSPMSSAQLKGCHEVQNLGAVQTYTRRYLWVAALEIVEHDAVDRSKGTEEDASGRLGEVVKALETQNGWALLNLAKVDEQGYRFAFGRLNTKQKALARELEQKAAVMRMEYVASLIECRENTDEAYANQLLEELPAEGKRMVWDMCPEDTKAFIRSLKEAK